MPLKNYLIFLFLLATVGLDAQTDSLRAPLDSLGEWRTLQSYRFGTYVTESENSIIYTTGKALFYLDKEDLSITRLAREDGLAEARIRLIRYHRPTETLIIVYENSVIDLLRDGRFSTLRQIDNFSFSGDKQIYDMYFGDDNVVYLAAGYGVSALSLDDETFVFTTFTGVRVEGAALHDGFIYAATEEGVYRARSENVNLNDFGNWNLMGMDFGLPGDYESTAMNVYKDKLYFGVNKDVYRLDGDTATLFFDTDDERDWRLQYLSVGPNLLLAGYRCTDGGCNNRQLMMLQEEGVVRRIFAQCIINTNYAIEDEFGRIWFGENSSSPRIRFLEDRNDGTCNEIEYSGPLTDDNYRLLHDGTSLWVAPSVLDDNFSASFNFGGAFRFRDGTWDAYNRNNNNVFLGPDGEINGDDDVAAIVDVHYDPVNGRHWFSSAFEGVVLWDEATETGTLFDETNSSLRLSPDAGPGRVRVMGAVTDEQGFTYFANGLAEDDSFISVRSPEGEWGAIGAGCGINEAVLIEIDQQGLIWVAHSTNAGSGITVTDPMGTPLDPSDDRCRRITANNSELPTNNVRSITTDLRGNVWVGTSQGIVIFSCQDALDAGSCIGDRPIVEADGFGGFLLETEEIRSITVDGGNRKWVGTSGGAYLLSPDGREQLLFFDQGNSPLLDNIVRDIAIDPNTGVVYFGTELGIISYRDGATSAPERTFAEELVIFPNPVEPGNTGPISITGLARDARVKITDLSGKLVDEGTATGGQYVWSGTDYNGRRVATGVYLVFASSNGRFGLNSGNSAVGKIVFVR
jgi:hypothetical protein